MGPPPRRSAYSDAIDKVRAEHSGTIKPSQSVLECARCGTKQVVVDVPGMRKCVKCGFEFGPLR